MASITTELTTIAEAVYGRQIRGAIHDAIEKVNTELTSTTSSESSLAGQLTSEVTRLDGSIASTKTELEGDIASAKTELEGDISAEGTRLEGVIASTKGELQDDITAAATAATGAQTEVQAIRTRADGVVESSAADAVKAQFHQARAAEKAVYQEIIDPSLWSPSYYRAGNGTRGNSTVMLSNYSDTYLPESWGLITADPAENQNIGFRLFGYDPSGTYVGIWDSTTQTFEASLARSRQPVRVNLDEIRALYPGYMFKVSATGNASDFTMTADTYGDHLHIFDKVASAQHPKSFDWLWTVGKLDDSGVPVDSTAVQRSEYIPVGAGTKLYFSAAHKGMKVMAYDKDWNFLPNASMLLPATTTSSATEYANRFTVRHDGYIRVLLKTANGTAISNTDTLGSLLSCVDYVEPAVRMSEKLRQYDWIPAALVNGIPTEVFPNSAFSGATSACALSTRSVHYAEHTVCVKLDPALYHITVAFFAADKTTLLRQIGGGTAGMVCIPKGMYYRLSINALPAATVTAALVEGYDFSAIDSLLWYGSTSGVGTVAIFQRSDQLITPEIQYSGRGITVRCSDPQYRIQWVGYDSADPYGGLKRTVSISSAARITPESYYRLIVKWDGEGVASVADAEAQLVWELAEDVDPGIAIAGNASLRHVDHGEIPSYYSSHMADKAAAINALRTNSRVQFAFVTDYHINAYSNKGGQRGNSGSLLKYLADNTMVDMCVNGGDVANGESGWSSTPPYMAQFRALERNGAAALRVPGMVTYFVAGNHDGGTSGNVGYSQLLTTDEAYMASGLQALRGHVTVDQGCPFQYYWDDTVHNVRYIVGALGLRDMVTTQSDEEAFRFLAAALRTAPANCGIVIFNHMLLRTDQPTTAYSLTGYLAGLVDAYNSRNPAYQVHTFTSSLSDFSACTGRVLAIIGGHSHFDYTYNTSGGVPVIVTTTDCAGGQFLLSGSAVTSKPRPTGDVREQAFDVFTIEPSTGKIWATRIGGGSESDGSGADRTWNV